MTAASTTPFPGTQLRIDGINGYAVPLRPEVLADLDPLEVAHVCMCLRLDDEQTGCVEEAVAAVRAGCYPARERMAA